MPQDDNILSEEQRTSIARALEERGVNRPCPRCGHTGLGIVDGYVWFPLSKQIGTYSLGGIGVPCASTFCARCGHLMFHALGALGLLPTPKEAPKEAPQEAPGPQGAPKS